MSFTHFSCDSRLVSPGCKAWRKNPAIRSACAGRKGMIKSHESVLPVCQADPVREYGRVERTHSPRRGNHRMLLRRAENRNNKPPHKIRATPQPVLPTGSPRKLSATAREAKASIQKGRPRISSEERSHIHPAYRPAMAARTSKKGVRAEFSAV